MKVKLLISRAGVSFSQSAGEVVEVDEAEGLRMIAAGQADAVAAEKIETAEAKPAKQTRKK